jgi:hypothetical protein
MAVVGSFSTQDADGCTPRAIDTQQQGSKFREDVQIQDAIDVAADAKRTHGGQTLDQFLSDTK